ncbi:hypothetical protein XabCFBP2524_19695 [Xanthomonas axonopodis pv. begoniae]|nr:hypothetical protein XabCFBP2524_19695 [Xanthomonas axonopodis pv. begoniae]
MTRCMRMPQPGTTQQPATTRIAACGMRQTEKTIMTADGDLSRRHAGFMMTRALDAQPKAVYTTATDQLCP